MKLLSEVVIVVVSDAVMCLKVMTYVRAPSIQLE